MQRFDASVVICTFRRPAMLESCLLSLRGQINPFGTVEVIVIDNCPGASAKAVVRHAGQGFVEGAMTLRYVVEANPGVASARNRGLAEARNPVICFIDDDERALPHWLETLLAPFGNTNIDIVAGEVEPDFGDQPRPEWLEDRFLHAYSCKLGWDTNPRLLTNDEWFIEGNCAFRKSLFSNRQFNANLGRKGDVLLSSEGSVFFDLRRKGAVAFFSPNAKTSHFIHPDRLSRKWLLKRMFYQGLSDSVAHKEFGMIAKLMNNKVSPEYLKNVDPEKYSGEYLEAMASIYYHFGYGLSENIC
ncbi:glycosyltransferase family 2 protein [Azospirillum sp.]|uniref:glycosyltransferase family 2 protein n=1 Tax=Azospirillum sp. TaxID=34012 RepID=UPI00262DC430|nr:glycosyltransferase family 2 protein [Azospirillum sp.]